MERGLYIAATGMLSDETRQDTIANNLANVDTVGFKGDNVVNESFGNMLISNMKNGRVEGNMSLGTRVQATVTDFSQGSLRATNSSWDNALQGDGFFAMQTPQGVQYTRNGQFQTNSDGVLTDLEGHQVLGVGGKPITVGTGEPLIQPDGKVEDAKNNVVGQIAVVQLDVAKSVKVGNDMWTGPVTGTPANTTIRQGYLENSTVNSVSEMVDMIEVMRSYESSQKAITQIDGTLDKAVNSVGVVQ